MLQSLLRHLDTTPEFKKQMLEKVDDNTYGNDMLEKLGIDTLIDSSHKESHDFAVQI